MEGAEEAKAFAAEFAIALLDAAVEGFCCCGGAAAGCCAPNMRANRESLYTHKDKLTVEVAKNFAGPAETSAKDLSLRVDVVVSIKFAVR